MIKTPQRYPVPIIQTRQDDPSCDRIIQFRDLWKAQNTYSRYSIVMKLDNVLNLESGSRLTFAQ